MIAKYGKKKGGEAEKAEGKEEAGRCFAPDESQYCCLGVVCTCTRSSMSVEKLLVYTGVYGPARYTKSPWFTIVIESCSRAGGKQKTGKTNDFHSSRMPYPPSLTCHCM